MLLSVRCAALFSYIRDVSSQASFLHFEVTFLMISGEIRSIGMADFLVFHVILHTSLLHFVAAFFVKRLESVSFLDMVAVLVTLP